MKLTAIKIKGLKAQDGKNFSKFADGEGPFFTG